MLTSDQTKVEIIPEAEAARQMAIANASDRQRQAAEFMRGHGERQVGDWEGPEGNPGEA